MGEDQVQLGAVETRPLDDVVPYWRNPRVISESAIESVAASIQKYGYQQPIVVDEHGVIIVGHTRYAALRHLGVSEAPVLVAGDLTPAQVKQYRLIDNRSGEYAQWDLGKLAGELEGMDGSLIQQLFGQLDEAEQTPVVEGTEPAPEAPVDDRVAFICPHCYHEWSRKVELYEIESGFIGSDEPGKAAES